MSLIRFVTRIHFADRVLEDALPEELRTRRIVAPLVLTTADDGSDDALARLLDALPPGCVARNHDISGDDRDALVALGCSAWREHGVDAVIGLGGARTLDAARLIGHVVAQAGGICSVIAVPTTPGAVGLGPLAPGLDGSPGICAVPDLLLCDPTLLRGVGGIRLAAAGMDALTRCLEALLCTTWNPPADGIAFDGLRRAGIWLDRAVADPSDPDALRELLAAALNGGLAAQKGYGGLHALAFALEAEVGPTAAEGRVQAALGPPVIRFNAPAVPERMALAADALGLSTRDTTGQSIGEHLAALGARIGLPSGLSALGINGSTLDRAAALAAEGAANRTNPRHATARDYRQLLEAAL